MIKLIIRVRFYGDVRAFMGTSWRTVEIIEGATLLGLIKELGKVVALDVEGMVLEGNELNPSIRVLVNGRRQVHLNGLATVLKDRDTVVIMPVAGGGP